MALRRPYLSVTGGGIDYVVRLGERLAGVTLTDLGGYESDEATIRIRGRFAPPARGTEFRVTAGWESSAMSLAGLYSFQRLSRSGDPESGEETHLICRAADFIDKMKMIDSEHFDDENGHTTYGDVIRTLARRVGVPAAIEGGIGSIPLPKVHGKPYLLRYQQSAIDLLTDIGDEIGAVIKPQAGRLVVRPRGSGQSVSGGALGTITLIFDRNYEYSVDIEPRNEFQKVIGGWFDPAKGRRVEEETSTRFQASRIAMPHPRASKEAAERVARALAQETGRYTGTGSFQSAGLPGAKAEMPVRCVGYGPGIDDIDWISSQVTHEIVPNVGWTTTVEVETKDQAQ